MTLHQPGPQHLGAPSSRPTPTGWWTYRVEGWSDPYGTWEHDATIKVAADVDTELMLEEGARCSSAPLAEVARPRPRASCSRTP